MKETLLCALSIVLLVLSLTGCSYGKKDDVGWIVADMEDTRVESTLETLLAALEEDNYAQAKSLFSPVVTAESGIYSKQIEELDAFYQGALVSYEVFGPAIEESIDIGKHIKIRRTAFAIDTTEKHYRIAMVEYLEHREEPEKVGIIAIYIGEETRYSLEGHAYWFGKYETWQPGIHIEVIDSY